MVAKYLITLLLAAAAIAAPIDTVVDSADDAEVGPRGGFGGGGRPGGPGRGFGGGGPGRGFGGSPRFGVCIVI